jgi:cytochrome P450/NADPH-cytochrome P450 reductase
MPKSTRGEDASPGKLQVEVTVERPEMLGEKDMTLATVHQHKQLAGTEVGPEKRLMEIRFNEDIAYQTGDYLLVLPTNHQDDVHRCLNRFDIPVDATVKLTGTRKSFLPQNHVEYAYSLVSAYLELGSPISRRQCEALVAATTDPQQKSELERLSQGEAFENELLHKRASVIDVLCRYPACKLSFGEYIDMLQPLKPRQYSIASSPLATAPDTVTIIYDVLDTPSKFDKDHQFHGVASSYLRQLPVGGKIHCYIKSTSTSFHLPTKSETPIVMICAGTGCKCRQIFVPLTRRCC